MEAPQILVVDLGSQYTTVIGRSIRELGFRTAILSPKKARDWLTQNKARCVILSGSDYSVSGLKAPTPPPEIFKSGAPILGICYGMQWLAEHFGGELFNELKNKEYGPATALIEECDPIFKGLKESRPVWASHGDSVKVLPPAFKCIARSAESGGITGMANHDLNI